MILGSIFFYIQIPAVTLLLFFCAMTVDSSFGGSTTSADASAASSVSSSLSGHGMRDVSMKCYTNIFSHVLQL